MTGTYWKVCGEVGGVVVQTSFRFSLSQAEQLTFLKPFFFKNLLAKLQTFLPKNEAACSKSALHNAANMFLLNSRGFQEMSKQSQGQNRNMWGNKLIIFFLGPVCGIQVHNTTEAIASKNYRP